MAKLTIDAKVDLGLLHIDREFDVRRALDDSEPFTESPETYRGEDVEQREAWKQFRELEWEKGIGQ